MLFQTLDNKGECVGVFSNGDLSFDEVPKGLTRTWSYAPYLESNIKYANLYCPGQTLDQVCPENLKGEWQGATGKMKAFIRSLGIAKVDLEEACFFDLVPERFLKEYCELKNRITSHVFETREEPENYEFLAELTALVGSIGDNKLNLDFEVLRNSLDSTQAARFYKKIQGCQPYIRYNIFGTKTGRLSTKKGTFPILNLDRRYRSMIKPTNDCFVELDYNAAELRTLLSLSGHPQPSEDLHVWNSENVFSGNVSREEAKKKIFSWLYNPNSNDRFASRAYDRKAVKEKYWDGEKVKTCFHREIQADEHHALNYLIQSTCSDMVLRQVIKLRKLLSGRKSRVAFIVHDSVVIDYSLEDKQELEELVQFFSFTELGRFRVGVQVGKDYGNMKGLKWT